MSKTSSPNISGGPAAINSNTPAEGSDPLERMPRFQRKILIAMILLTAFAVLALFSVLTGAHLWIESKQSQVASVQPAGRLVMVTQATGLITRSLVETDTGFYSLVDSASFQKNEPLTLETRGNRMRYLCDAGHRCTALNDSF